LHKPHLAKIIEAAIISSHDPQRSLLVTGLEMFERVDGQLVGEMDQTHLFWTEVPEFGFLMEHRVSNAGGNVKGKGGKEVGLRERMGGLERGEAGEVLREAFGAFLGGLLGWEVGKGEGMGGGGGGGMGVYGLDSLSGVSCQYWVYRGMCFLIFGGGGIREIG